MVPEVPVRGRAACEGSIRGRALFLFRCRRVAFGRPGKTRGTRQGGRSGFGRQPCLAFVGTRVERAAPDAAPARIILLVPQGVAGLHWLHHDTMWIGSRTRTNPSDSLSDARALSRQGRHQWRH